MEDDAGHIRIKAEAEEGPCNRFPVPRRHASAGLGHGDGLRARYEAADLLGDQAAGDHEHVVPDTHRPIRTDLAKEFHLLSSHGILTEIAPSPRSSDIMHVDQFAFLYCTARPPDGLTILNDCLAGTDILDGYLEAEGYLLRGLQDEDLLAQSCLHSLSRLHLFQHAGHIVFDVEHDSPFVHCLVSLLSGFRPL